MLATGTEIAGYVIEGLLGRGGMGLVYEARQISLDRRVALKVLRPQLTDDPAFALRFQREGRVQASIDHPHILPIYEAGECDGSLFLAMRLVRGATLKEMIVGRELEGGRTLRILGAVADALEAAHAAGLVHRDIKPQNLLVSRRDHPYLADFGLGKTATETTGLTRTGEFVGTVDYVAPELIHGRDATEATDVYALAAVLYECLSGVVPYPRESDAAVLFGHLSDPPPRVTGRRPELPAALDDVIARGMAKDPADRFTSATELIARAQAAFGEEARAAITPPEPLTRAEDTGLREVEARVPTRPTPVPRLPAPVRDQTWAAPRTPARRSSARPEPALLIVAAVLAAVLVLLTAYIALSGA